MDRRIGVDALVGLAQALFRLGVLSRLEVGPAQRVQIGAVLGFEVDRLANHLERLRQLLALFSEHVSEVVQHRRIPRVDHQSLAELDLSLVVHLLAIVKLSAQKKSKQLFFGFGRQSAGLVQLCARVLESLEPNVHLDKSFQRVEVIRISGQLRLCQGQTLVHLPHVGELLRVRHLDRVVLRKGLRCGC